MPTRRLHRRKLPTEILIELSRFTFTNLVFVCSILLIGKHETQKDKPQKPRKHEPRQQNDKKNNGAHRKMRQVCLMNVSSTSMRNSDVSKQDMIASISLKRGFPNLDLPRKFSLAIFFASCTDDMIFNTL